MKKVLLSILSVLLILSFSNINAQTRISLGARAGLNIASLSYSPDIASGVTKSSRTGFKFGALVEIGFTPMIAVQIEPMFVAGAGSELSSTFGKATLKLSYLEFPILFKFKIPVSGSVRPYVFAGPNIGLVMSAKVLNEPNGFPSSESDQKDFTSSILFALDFGAGAGFNMAPNTTLIFDVRYSFGMSNLLNEKGGSATQSIKANGLQILAGVMFGL